LHISFRETKQCLQKYVITLYSQLLTKTN